MEGETQRKEEWLKKQNIRGEVGGILKTKESAREGREQLCIEVVESILSGMLSVILDATQVC